MESLAEKRFNVPEGATLEGEEAIAFLEDKVRLAGALGEGWKITMSPKTLKMWLAVGRDYWALAGKWEKAQTFRVPFTKLRLNYPSRYMSFWLGWCVCAWLRYVFS